jgi:hypothetical protein
MGWGEHVIFQGNDGFLLNGFMGKRERVIAKPGFADGLQGAPAGAGALTPVVGFREGNEGC